MGRASARCNRRGPSRRDDGRDPAFLHGAPRTAGDPAPDELWRREAGSDLGATKAWESLGQTIDIRPLLSGVRCPTLLLVGELDLICGPAHSRAIAEAIPHAEVVTVPDCGHFVPGEAPEAFREAVVAFCG